jgi:hypothetical protein
MHHLIEFSEDLLGWAGVLAGLAILAGLLALMGRPRARQPIDVAETATRLEPAREWELVMRRAAQDLSRGAELAALQANTALKIASAEHAYNRLFADCAKLCRVSAPSAPAPAPQLSAEHESRTPGHNNP